MSKIELPPLPRQVTHAMIAGPQGAEYRRLSEEWEPDVARHSDETLRARDRQIVELCASIAREFRRGAGDPVCAEVAAAIRSLLDPAEKEQK